MAELDTTVAGRHADGSPYNADGALLVTITNDEPAPRGPTPSDGNYSFDGILQFHDDAATLSTADYSTASFAETETLPDGQVVGKLGETFARVAQHQPPRRSVGVVRQVERFTVWL